MDSSLSYRVRIASSLGALLLLAVFPDARVCAQDQIIVPSVSAPPPMKFIPSPDRAQLSTSQDPKTRLKTSINLAETRLLRAEQFTVDQRFIAATTELGVYQAVIEDCLRFLSLQKVDSNKTRDMYKRLEIQLRLHALRIEAMRRVTPVAYAVHIKAIWAFSDGARARALNAFFSDTVVPQNSAENEKTSGPESSPGTTGIPTNKPQ